MKMNPLKDKVVLITGAGKGAGQPRGILVGEVAAAVDEGHAFVAGFDEALALINAQVHGVGQVGEDGLNGSLDGGDLRRGERSRD